MAETISVPEIVSAIQSQNTVNPAGQVGSEPVPKGQEYTYSVRAQGRLSSPEEFGEIVVRESPGGAIVRLKDVARVELGAQNYSVVGRLNGKPGAIIAVYQLPGSNAVEAANGVRKLFADVKTRLPSDMDYVLSLDTTRAVTQGMKEIVLTLVIAIILVIIVVYIFLQGWRATLIPLLAVPVSLVGTFMFFPLFGFSVNTLSLFGLVLAIGLVVDDAIVVVEAVERHIEEGLAPKAAAFNALTLSPALAALLLRPKTSRGGLLRGFFAWFNRAFANATNAYVRLCGVLIRKSAVALILLGAFAAAAGWFGSKIPS